MKIRSITYFCDPKWPLDDDVLQQAGDFIAEARPAFEAAGYQVQTVRLATIPFPRLVNLDSRSAVSEAIDLAQALEAAVTPLGFDYIAIGPALPAFPESYQVIPEVLESTKNVFASAVMSSSEVGISLPAVRACAEIVHRLAPQDPKGFANLYFAALANVPPGAPFFPAAYHGGGAPAFAIATEAADLAVEAFSGAKNLADARHRLSRSIESHAGKLVQIADSLTRQFAIPFGGIDFSLAPFPEGALSLGTAFERLGVPAVGLHGSLAAAALITETIDRADFPHTGFSGLMLPVLEDSALAARAAEGHLTVKDLLLYSAVCGTGLDTMPLPGDTTPGQLTAILLDLAALAQRLDKPLTARLMPIPGKRAGDPTDFDFAFFANSRVMALEAEPLEGLFSGEEAFKLRSRLDR
ncbi:MAG: DUF711 family protein [Anaerolineales bacterium]|nr:DUF711 family protein [Anaerolineales bacterium]